MTVQISLKRNNRVFHTVSKAMWQLNATFANSQSCRKRKILSPGQYKPMTWNASLHTLPSREPLEETLSSSDQASPSLSHIGLFGQPIFHSSPRPGTWHPSPSLTPSAITCKATSAHFLRTSAEKRGVRMSSLKKGLKVSLPGWGVEMRLSFVMLMILCSVNTACDPESSLTMSPRSTTLPLYFWHWGSNSEFLRWQRSINDAKWSFLPSFLASSITSFFVSDFRQRYLFLFVLFFSTASFASGMFNAWGIGIKLCIKLQWLSEFITFAAMWSSWYFCGTPSNRIFIDSSASTITSILGLVLPNIAAGFSAAMCWCFSRHCCWHRNFQLSTSVFHGKFKFFIIRFNEEDTT